MHVQARASTAASEADLGPFLERLADINIEGVSGGGIESRDDGRFVFVVEDGREAECHDLLTRAPAYNVEWTTDLYHEALGPGDGPAAAPAVAPDPNRPGVLFDVVVRAKQSRLEGRSRKVDGVLIGAFTGKKNHFFAQVTFEDSVWTTDRPGPHPSEG